MKRKTQRRIRTVLMLAKKLFYTAALVLFFLAAFAANNASLVMMIVFAMACLASIGVGVFCDYLLDGNDYPLQF